MYQNPKSATTAGLLGIFLGAFGAHNWYLGEKGKGIAHVCMMGSGLLLEIVTAAILPNVLTFSALLSAATILGVLGIVASLAMSASAIWGLVEGIIILAQGDAGLARKGYAVETPVAPQGGYPVNGQYGYGPQPMQPMQPMQQPYYGQPMPQQPMQPMQQPYYGQPMPQQPTQQSFQPEMQPSQQEPAPSNNVEQPGQPGPIAGGFNE